jgi:hypothetical protein
VGIGISAMWGIYLMSLPNMFVDAWIGELMLKVPKENDHRWNVGERIA